MSEHKEARDEGWAIWFREGGQPDGRWYCWWGTSSSTRRDAIDKAIAGRYGMLNGPTDWRRQRRKGLVSARRTIFTAPSFGDPRFP